MAVKKELKKVITFPTTTCALEAERLSKSFGLFGRLIPVPTIIKAGCGMAFCTAPEFADAAVTLFNENKVTIEGIFELEI